MNLILRSFKQVGKSDEEAYQTIIENSQIAQKSINTSKKPTMTNIRIIIESFKEAIRKLITNKKPCVIPPNQNDNQRIWCDMEYNEDEKGNMRWEFEIWNFGYEDAFDYCKDIWLAFGYNVVVWKYIDCVETLVWYFSIDDLPCVWCFNDFPPYHYVFPIHQTDKKLQKLKKSITIIIDELNRLVEEKEITPYM